MNEFDPEQFEAELRALRPAQLPQRTRAQVLRQLSPRQRRPEFPDAAWPQWIQWLIPASAVAALAAFIVTHAARSVPQATTTLVASTDAPLRADKVELDRQLLARFDAIGRLPDGRSVRFRCAQWRDDLRVRDSTAGLILERTTPRLEIVPIGFETD